jgi:hypothetical protein
MGKLSEYHYTIQYRKGSLIVFPVALSRRHDYQLAVMSESIHEVRVDVLDACREAIVSDKYFKEIYERATKTQDEDNPYEFTLANGILYIPQEGYACMHP